MNKVVLMGRLTKEPDVRYTQGENPIAIARFILAVNRRYVKDGEQTADFISCLAFGKTAEFYEKYGHKGTKFVIEGRIQTGSYTNKNGVKVYTTEIVVENTEFAESKRESTEQTFVDEHLESYDENNGFIDVSMIDVNDEELPFV